MECETIERIADFLKSMRVLDQHETGPAKGEIELSPVMSWFFQRELKRPEFYNQSVLLKLNTAVSRAQLNKTFSQLIDHHDGLRLNYSSEKNGVYYNAKHLGTEFTVEEISIDANAEVNEQVKLAANKLKSGFNLKSSLLIKAMLLHINGANHLLITCHHLIIDGVSWRVLLQDLHDLLLDANQSMDLGAKTASYGSWASMNNSISVQHDRKFWEDMSKKAKVATGIETNTQQTLIREGKLNVEQTKIIEEAAQEKFGFSIDVLLLTALTKALKSNLGATQFIELEHHGRTSDELNVSRTIGWFTSLYPVMCQLPESGLETQLIAIKEQLAEVPNHGMAYGILQQREAIPKINCPVRFNFLGKFDFDHLSKVFELSSLDSGNDVSSENNLGCDLEVNCMIRNQQLEWQFNYDPSAFSADTMDQIMKKFEENLSSIVHFLSGTDGLSFSPSDFELVELDQNDLDSIFS